MKKILIVLVIALLSIVKVNANYSQGDFSNYEYSDLAMYSSDAEYWSGWAIINSYELYITVYQTPGQCNAFTAKATKWRLKSVNGNPDIVRDIDKTLVVKKKGDRYYVTYDNQNYYFRM